MSIRLPKSPLDRGRYGRNFVHQVVLLITINGEMMLTLDDELLLINFTNECINILESSRLIRDEHGIYLVSDRKV